MMSSDERNPNRTIDELHTGHKSRIVLYTVYKPGTGGGGAILRSLLPYLNDCTVLWAYSGQEAVGGGDAEASYSCEYLGPSAVRDGASGIADVLRLWNGGTSPAFQNILTRLEAYDADTYWVVGDMEATLIAEHLARPSGVAGGASSQKRRRRVHLSVHDDPMGGQFMRSKRFRLLAPLADRATKRALQSASSVDTVCRGMRTYYQNRFGVDSVVIHRFLAPPHLSPPPAERDSLAAKASAPPYPSTKTITAGHIGSIYSVTEFRNFCLAFQEYARQESCEPVFVVVAGRTDVTAPVFEEFKQMIVDLPNRPERDAVSALSDCDFLYAMYPFHPRCALFRQTSSPTKLTTYLQVQKPILAHTPGDSSLKAIVMEYDLGAVCESIEVGALIETIKHLRRSTVDAQGFERARDELHGEANVARLQACLTDAEKTEARR